MAPPVLVWFRDDLRVADNPALDAAARTGMPVLCLYVFDEATPGIRPLGGASRWWLHGSLDALRTKLAELGADLVIVRGAAEPLLQRIVTEAGIARVFWNRRYGAARALDERIAAEISRLGVGVEHFNAHLLREPGEVTTKAGGSYKVFTPYWKAASAMGGFGSPLPAPKALQGARWPAGLKDRAVALESLALEPTKPDWAGGLRASWTRGEAGAQARLQDFLDRSLNGYAANRNRPDKPGTSRLSPHLRFGEIGPRQLAHAALTAHDANPSAFPKADLDKVMAEVGWRDFSYQLLHESPDIATRPMTARYAAFPFRDAPCDLAAWQRDRTGYPIVDAGLRELWVTGWMHNRVRLIAASFLVKHLLIDWRKGERWFWDTLVDADPANNAVGWQWIAGSGADASPFYRVFNPVAQGEKFDPQGAYVRRWLPQLAGLPDRLIHQPWTASAAALAKAGVTLGETYPHRIVEHEAARRRALAAFATIRKAA